MKNPKIILLLMSVSFLPNAVFAAKGAQLTCPNSGSGTGEITTNYSAFGGFKGQGNAVADLTFKEGSEFMEDEFHCKYTDSKGADVMLATKIAGGKECTLSGHNNNTITCK